MEKEEILTVDQLKQIYDDSIKLSSSNTFYDYLINTLDRLNQIDQAILIDPLIVNHQFYSLITIVLKDILKTWHRNYYLNEHESILFYYITRILYKMKISPEILVYLMKKCLKDIAKNGRHLFDKNNIKSFSKLVELYEQNQEIINAILKCLCSNNYIDVFEKNENEKFLLLKCPVYWINYKGKSVLNLMCTYISYIFFRPR